MTDKVKKSGEKKKFIIKDKLDDDYLDLSLCDLETVPLKEIVDLGKVRRLNLSYNSLTYLPDDFATKLSNLKEIDLSKNHLTKLPKNFGQLVNLKSLDLLGNKLTNLPTSFFELKSLQWLDLKDNPLEPKLKQAAGDCLDESQCKKCAINVIKYVKQVASDEERLRQIELKKKKDEQLKKEALEKEKAEELKQVKKLEREQRRIANEQRKLEREEIRKNKNENENVSKSKVENRSHTNQKSSFCSSFISTLFVLILLSLALVTVYFYLGKYCGTSQNRAKSDSSLLNHEMLQPALKLVNEKVCPNINEKHLPIMQEFLNNLLNSLHII